jgi:hypothetical protein
VATCAAQRRIVISTTGWASTDSGRLVAVNDVKMEMHLFAATHADEAVDVSFQCVNLMEKGQGVRRGPCRGYPFSDKATEIVINDVSVGLWVFLVSMSCSSE